MKKQFRDIPKQRDNKLKELAWTCWGETNRIVNQIRSKVNQIQKQVSQVQKIIQKRSSAISQKSSKKRSKSKSNK